MRGGANFALGDDAGTGGASAGPVLTPARAAPGTCDTAAVHTSRSFCLKSISASSEASGLAKPSSTAAPARVASGLPSRRMCGESNVPVTFTGVRSASGLKSCGCAVMRRSSVSLASDRSPSINIVVSLVSTTNTSGITLPLTRSNCATAHCMGSLSSPLTNTPSACATSMPAASTRMCETVPSRTQTRAVPSSEASSCAADLPAPLSCALPPSAPLMKAAIWGAAWGRLNFNSY